MRTDLLRPGTDRVHRARARARSWWAAARRSRSVRRAARSRAAAIVVALVVAAVVVAQTRAAERLERRWGATTAVWVARADLPAGHQLVDDDLLRADWPDTLVPPDAVHGPLPSRRLRADVAAGEVIVAARLADPGRGGWSAALEPDEVAVQLPLAEPQAGLARGDHVDVVAPAAGTAGALDPTDPSGAATHVVARDARVVAVSATSVTVAVARAHGASTAAAALGGLVSIVVRP